MKYGILESQDSVIKKELSALLFTSMAIFLILTGYLFGYGTCIPGSCLRVLSICSFECWETLVQFFE
jgi:hypothetical protein